MRAIRRQEPHLTRRLRLVPRDGDAPPAPDAGPEAGGEAYFRSLLENARDVIHVLDADGTTRYVTPSVTRLLGWTPEELVGRHALELVHPDDQPGLFAALARHGEGAEQALEFRVPHQDGSWRTFEGVGRNLLGDPAVRGIVVSARDVTERKHAQEESLRLAAFPRENPDPILECDRAGATVYVNPACDRLVWELGVRRPERLLPRDHARIVAECLETATSARDVEVQVGTRVLAWNYHPQPPLGTVYLFGHEITERKRVEERLIQ
ncbi:MAG TPA: PAS domain S-box protein, partial [Longimicrobiaceae bacterium]|nr:PAS domain S-box protein [Longimicrobiaceae bacterium]